MAEDALRYLTLSATDDGLAELDGARRLVFVPRADIMRIELAYGVTAERPLLAALFGLVLLPLVLWPALEIGGALLGTRESRVFLGSIFAGALGGILGGTALQAALRRRLHLVVHTARDRRKLLLDGLVERRAVEAFLDAIEARWHYPVQHLGDAVWRALEPPPRPPPG